MGVHNEGEVWSTIALLFSLIFNDHFSGAGRAVGPVCMYVSVCVPGQQLLN